MSSRHLVDPELTPLLELFPTMQFSADLLPEIRLHELPVISDPGAAARVAVDIRAVPGPNGAPEVSVRIYTPREGNLVRPCIFHMHGGGYVVGTGCHVGSRCTAPWRSTQLQVIVSEESRIWPPKHRSRVESRIAMRLWPGSSKRRPT